MEVVRKSRTRFCEADDLALLREVLGHRPFINSSNWSIIDTNMSVLTGKNFKLKTLRDHLQLLIKTWLERKKTCEGKLGSIDYTEKDILCREIYNLMKENKSKKDREVEKGLSSRDSWTKTAFNHVEHIIYDNDRQSDDLDLKDEKIIIKVSENEEDLIEITEANFSSEKAHSRTRYDSLMSENVNPASPALREETSSPTSNHSSQVANPNKAKKRRAVQKQGLEEYDRLQFELKKRDQELEERRLLLEEKKIVLEERRLKLEEKKLEIEKMEKMKNFEILEKKIELEREDREERRKLINRSDNIIHILLKRLEKP